jgi:hypothetical protein
VFATNTINGATRQYNGRQKLDDALLDRMAILELPLDNAVEASLLGIQEKSKLNGDLQRGGLVSKPEWLALTRAIRHTLTAKGMKHVAPSPRAGEYGGKLCSTLGRYWLVEMLLVRGLGDDVRNVVETEMQKGY